MWYIVHFMTPEDYLDHVKFDNLCDALDFAKFRKGTVSNSLGGLLQSRKRIGFHLQGQFRQVATPCHP